MAAEVQACSSALAEAEWIQALIKETCFDQSPAPGWESSVGPFVSVLSKDREMGRDLCHQHVVDAKSLYDCLSKDVAGGRSDRRAGIDMAIVRDSLRHSASTIRWVPHHCMPADTLTKADVGVSSYALAHLLKT